MKITNEQLDEIKDYLLGSCKSLNEAISSVLENDDLSEDDLTDDQLKSINNDMFYCVDCGWWYEISEESGVDESELVCNSCSEDR